MKYFLILFLLLQSITIVFSRGEKLVAGENAHWVVTMKTSEGHIKLKLYNDTPLHRDNFLSLIKEGFYDNLLFHRVIENFMIQCGDPKSREASAVTAYGDSDSGTKISHEILPHYFHRRGILAAAREPDETNPNRFSSGSHFYIVYGKVHTDSTLQALQYRSDNYTVSKERSDVYKREGGAPHLDNAYTIFGEVIKGMKTVKKINISRTHKSDRPIKDIFIHSATAKLVKD